MFRLVAPRLVAVAILFALGAIVALFPTLPFVAPPRGARVAPVTELAIGAILDVIGFSAHIGFLPGLDVTPPVLAVAALVTAVHPPLAFGFFRDGAILTLIAVPVSTIPRLALLVARAELVVFSTADVLVFSTAVWLPRHDVAVPVRAMTVRIATGVLPFTLPLANETVLSICSTPI